MLDLIRHDREAAARIAGARCFDQGVEGEKGGLAIDVVDIGDFSRRDFPDVMRQFDDFERIRHGMAPVAEDCCAYIKASIGPGRFHGRYGRGHAPRKRLAMRVMVRT
jgi:hypothetical protein